MNEIVIKNLKIIIHEFRYPHILLGLEDIYSLLKLPEEGRQFYPARPYRPNLPLNNGKRGYFNNGHTTIWENWRAEDGTIKIANSLPQDIYKGYWSDTFSLKEENSTVVISKYMKLKAFW